MTILYAILVFIDCAKYITMPRLSLFRPEKGNDYKFIDRTIREMFQVGGAEIYIHKYLGPKNPSESDSTADQPVYDSVKETNIQDLLFLENRDRIYDPDIYKIRGVYNVQDIDFNLSQFGLFIDNDTVYMTVHINDYIQTIGRKPLSGDVIEVPNLRDEFALNDYDIALPRYFVISDVGRAAEGFSPTWYPHLYRLRLTKISDSQQYADIFNRPVIDPLTGEPTDLKLGELISNNQRLLDINDSVIAQAESDAPLSGYETQHFYTLTLDEKGNAALQTVDDSSIDASIVNDRVNASIETPSPKRSGYTGYLLGDGIPENGAAFGHGITFPNSPLEGDYFLRTDFLPNRLFRYDGFRWVKREDSVRASMTPSSTRNTQKGTFINNSKKIGFEQLANDVVFISSNTIVTDIDFIVGMFAEAATEDSPFRTAQEVTNVGGKAAIVLSDDYQSGQKVDWKLYKSAVDERQALSKVLRKKPGADF
jgi:hypothetical protein